MFKKNFLFGFLIFAVLIFSVNLVYADEIKSYVNDKTFVGFNPVNDRDIEVAPSKYIYRILFNDSRVLVYDVDLGRTAFIIGSLSKSSADGFFVDPRGVTVAKDGFVYVVDLINSTTARIQKFTPTGQFISKIMISNPPSGGIDVYVDAAGNYYLSGYIVQSGENYALKKYTSTGQFVRNLAPSYFDGTTRLNAGYIVITASDELYAAYSNGLVRKFNKDTGDILAAFNLPGIDFLNGFAIDNHGNYFAANYKTDKVAKFSKTLEKLLEFSVVDPFRLYLNAEGELFITTLSNEFTKYNPSTSADQDQDEVLDDFDNCVLVANPGQEDIDNDGQGDACDADKDADGILNVNDNCEAVANPNQSNFDNDSLGDVCDVDDDNDGVVDIDDSCQFEAPVYDADVDGCTDTAKGLTVVLEMVTLSTPQVETSLIKKVESAVSAYDRGNPIAGNNSLEAFIKEVEAQSGKALSEEEALFLITYATGVIEANGGSLSIGGRVVAGQGLEDGAFTIVLAGIIAIVIIVVVVTRAFDERKGKK